MEQMETTQAGPVIPEILPQVDPEVAVKFLIEKGLEWALSQADTTARMLFKPILGNISSRIDGITREQAIGLIQTVHQMSYDLEERTGVINEFFGVPE